jgi:hypothetical protein
MPTLPAFTKRWGAHDPVELHVCVAANDSLRAYALKRWQDPLGRRRPCDDLFVAAWCGVTKAHESQTVHVQLQRHWQPTYEGPVIRLELPGYPSRASNPDTRLARIVGHAAEKVTLGVLRLL